MGAEQLVQTVLGPMEPGALGITLPHEHLVISFDRLWRPPPDDRQLGLSLSAYGGEQRAVANHDPNLILDAIGNPSAHLLVDELTRFRAAGGSTLVEVTPIGLGRNPAVLAGLSKLSGINIVMSTSFYTEPFHPPFTDHVDAGLITDLFVRELTVGVDDTGIRSGIIGEIGTSSPVTDAELKVLRAAAMAQQITGVSINVHRTSYPDGDAVVGAVDQLLSLGVVPDRVVVSHCDERPDPALALKMAARGVYVELDTFGMESWAVRWPNDKAEIPAATDTDRIRIVLELLDQGHGDQLLVSQDVCNKAQLRAFGGYGYSHLLENVRDRLVRNGVGQGDLDRIFVTNPARVLTPA